MKSIYTQPKKVILVLFLLTLTGLLFANRMPVSLYPNSAKPEYSIKISLRNFTAQGFLNEYGGNIHAVLRELIGVEKIITEGSNSSVQFEIKYKWGLDAKEVKRELLNAVEAIRGNLPKDLKDHLSHWKARSGGGFYAASISTPDGDISALKKKLEPIIMPRVNELHGLDHANLYDPNEKNLFVTLNPEKLAAHRLSVDKVNRFIPQLLQDINGGSVRFSDNQYQVLMENQVHDETELANAPLGRLGRPGLRLKDIALVELAPDPEGNRILKTDGEMSLILFASPGDDGNLKTIGESLNAILAETQHLWPANATYKVIVDPSTFIRAAIQNVNLNIFLGGICAVLVLLLFMGNLRATVFSAIEIPLAITWAFILMYCFDVGLNLISLGGLALTAGMNIDSSIVMVENILRHIGLKKPKNYNERLAAILTAVNEVKWPIVTSTLSTVIVFLPLSITSGIAYAILGDLAKAVIFSHSLSLIVAVILVPTIRLHIKSNEEARPFFIFALFDRAFQIVVKFYTKFLSFVMRSSSRSYILLAIILISVVSIPAFLFKKIRKEIIALPNTELIWIDVDTEGAKTTAEVSEKLRPYEQMLATQFSDIVKYTFTQINSPRNSGILAVLFEKNQMESALDRITEALKSSPEVRFTPMPWNPSKLPLPRNPDLKIVITGEEPVRIEAAELINLEVKSSKKFNWAWANMRKGERIKLTPKHEYFNHPDSLVDFNEIGELIFTLISGYDVGTIQTSMGARSVKVRFPFEMVKSTEDIAALPIMAGDKIIPLKAIVDIKTENYSSSIYEEDGQRMTKVQGYFKRKYKKNKEEAFSQVKSLIEKLELPVGASLRFLPLDQEVDEALQGLIIALLLSLLLIASIVYLQFGAYREVLAVLSAIPLGLIGVSLSLWAFDSTWSINSLLGTIMLAGISVNNSILLVSFFKQRQSDGLNATAAAIDAAKTRLRPILITSLTTIFALSPIAFGMGEGSEVLQPLGIAVSGGMIFSTFLTIFVVPILCARLNFEKA